MNSRSRNIISPFSSCSSTNLISTLSAISLRSLRTTHGGFSIYADVSENRLPFERYRQNNFSAIDISLGLDLEPSPRSPYFLLCKLKRKRRRKKWKKIFSCTCVSISHVFHATMASLVRHLGKTLPLRLRILPSLRLRSMCERRLRLHLRRTCEPGLSVTFGRFSRAARNNPVFYIMLFFS